MISISVPIQLDWFLLYWPGFWSSQWWRCLPPEEVLILMHPDIDVQSDRHYLTKLLMTYCMNWVKRWSLIPTCHSMNLLNTAVYLIFDYEILIYLKHLLKFSLFWNILLRSPKSVGLVAWTKSLGFDQQFWVGPGINCWIVILLRSFELKWVFPFLCKNTAV